MGDQISAEENFHHVYRLFWLNLNILEKDCVTQCNMNGNFNVAGELQNELLRDAFTLLNYDGNVFTEEQRRLIIKLMAGLEAVPSSVISGDRTSHGSQRDMSHPCWIPLREQAAKLLRVFQLVTSQNEEYFRTMGS